MHGELPPAPPDAGFTIVDAPEGAEVYYFDLQGRLLAKGRRFEAPQAGVYVIKVDGMLPRRIIII